MHSLLRSFYSFIHSICLVLLLLAGVVVQALHAENGLSERFPIGLKPLIEAWQLEDVQTYHDTHYYPGNALLYVIGDLPVEQMEKQLAQVMGKVRG